jgi:probable rRNA maturation factor
MTILIVNRQRTKKINTRLVRRIAVALLGEFKIAEAELGVNLVGRKEMTEINERFLRHAGPTDVVAFNFADDHGAGIALHGELFICVPEAVAQSRVFGADWQSELVRYLVHGVLHLLGHDDRRPAARRRMQREENRRLRSLAGKFCLAQIGRS